MLRGLETAGKDRQAYRFPLSAVERGDSSYLSGGGPVHFPDRRVTNYTGVNRQIIWSKVKSIIQLIHIVYGSKNAGKIVVNGLNKIIYL